MSRLSSFQGPSTPSKSPVGSPEVHSSPGGNTPTKGNRSSRSKQQSGRRRDQFDTNYASLDLEASTINNKTAFKESNVQKELRELLLEIRNDTRKWDNLVQEEGFKAAKEMVDARTTIQNALSILPSGQIPRRPVVGPQMSTINERIKVLDIMFEQLQGLFDDLTNSVESLEVLHIAAVNYFYGLNPADEPAGVLSPEFMDPDTPLYPTTTWSLARFCTVIPPLILPFYHRQLHSLRKIYDELRRTDIEWERARSLLALWKEGGYSLMSQAFPTAGMVNVDGLFIEAGWSNELEEICSIEIRGWK